MIEMSTLKVLLNRIVNETELNQNNYKSEQNETKTLVENSMEKILDIFDEYYNLNLKINFSIDFNNDNYHIRHKHSNDGRDRCIWLDCGVSILLTRECINNGKVINDFTNSNNYKNCGFDYGIADGIRDHTSDEKLLRTCEIIADNIDEIKRKMASKLIIVADEYLDKSFSKLNKITETNNILREFTKDVTVDDSNDEEKEVATE